MTDNINDSTKKQQRELKLLRSEKRDLLKKLDWFEKQGHSTVGIAFLRRHLGGTK